MKLHVIGRVVLAVTMGLATWNLRAADEAPIDSASGNAQATEFPLLPIEPTEVEKDATSDAPSENPTSGSTLPAKAAETAGAKDEKAGTVWPQSADTVALRQKVQRVLQLYFDKRLNSRDNTPWEVMHALIAYGAPTDILRDGPDGPRVNAIGWLANGFRCKNEPLLVLDGNRVTARVGVDVQGHPGQFLGMLAQASILDSYDFKVQGKSFTLADLIEQEKLGCQPNIELTFKLIALSYYLPNDATWTSRDGQRWSIPRLIHAELDAPIRGATCGGAHRLFGLSSACLMRQCKGGKLDGEYLRAKKYVNAFQQYTFKSLQNADGSLSTEWFVQPGAQRDLDRRLQTNGHMLEWLAYSLADDQLGDPRMVKSISYLTKLLLEHPQRKWNIGSLGHSLHALSIYEQRALSADPATDSLPAAAAATAEPPVPNADTPEAPKSADELSVGVRPTLHPAAPK